MKIHFGKYGPKHYPPDGLDISLINSGYLQWLMSEDWFVDRDDNLTVAVENELKERDKWNGHFYDDKVVMKGR